MSLFSAYSAFFYPFIFVYIAHYCNGLLRAFPSFFYPVVFFYIFHFSGLAYFLFCKELSLPIGKFLLHFSHGLQKKYFLNLNFLVTP